MPMSLSLGVVLFAVYALAGWGLEVVYRSATQRKLVNPGFLHGPFVPLYGFGALLVLGLGNLLGGWPAAAQLVAYGLAITALEYATGALVEAVLHVRLWDYTSSPLNLHGRVSLPFSAVWTALSVAFARWIHPLVLAHLVATDPTLLRVTAIVVAAYLALDWAAAIATARVLQPLLLQLRTSLARSAGEEMERLLARVARLRGAFPDLNDQLLASLRSGLRTVVNAHARARYEQLIARLEGRSPTEADFHEVVEDILVHPVFCRLHEFRHHDASIYDHARGVAWISYRVCKRAGLDYRSAARGALMHDFFLYDWRNHDLPDLAREKFHGLAHPRIALRNAEAHFVLNAIERDCILRHMWPLTPVPPRHRESFVVCMVDKVVASREFVNGIRRRMGAWAQ